MTNKNKLLYTVGIPASGKTTWAKEFVLKEAKKGRQWKNVNKDDLRSMFDSGKWTGEKEKFIIKIQDELIISSLKAGYSVVVSDTNLHEKHKKRFEDIGKELGVEVIRNDEFLSVDLDECIKRDKGRHGEVGQKVIHGMWKQFIHKPYEFDPDLPKCVIADCDGTINLVTDRSAYEGQHLHRDLPNDFVIEYINMLKEKGYYIFCFSGLDGEFYELREQWLKDHGVNYDELHMRKPGDNRKDWIIKDELFKEYIEGKYNVHVILDDRKQMLKYYSKKGLSHRLMALGDVYEDF